MEPEIIPGSDRLTRAVLAHLRSPDFAGLRVEVVEAAGSATRFRLLPPRFSVSEGGRRLRLIPLDAAGHPERYGLRRPDLETAEEIVILTLSRAVGGLVLCATGTQGLVAELCPGQAVRLVFQPPAALVPRI